jgi:glycosyltransferase involved in cell wall biosynthesis
MRGNRAGGAAGLSAQGAIEPAAAAGSEPTTGTARRGEISVMLASPSMQAGGAERVLTLLASDLAAHRHRVALIAPHGPRDGDLRDVPHLRLPLHDRGRTAGIALEAFELARAIRRAAPDVIHVQNPRLAALVSIATRVARPSKRPPVVATFHGVLPSEYAGAARLLRLTDHVVCVSEDLRDQLISAGFPSQRASVIYNAVEQAEPLSAGRREAIDAELGLRERPVAAIVARIVPQKVHARFIAAATIAAERVPDARFLIVGEGPLRTQVETAVQAIGLADSVVFTGVRPDARQLIERADVLVFSSDWEGLSIAALEAMAAGTPVLSTDVQGMRELLSCGAGEIVPIDDGTALGQSLAGLLLDQERRQAMGAAGKALVEARHTVRAMTCAYEQRYLQMLDR